MTISAAQFRLDYPEFANVGTYPDSGVNYWLNLAYLMLRPDRWSTVIDVGAELFAAHNLVLEAQAARAAATGNLPGVQTGAVSGKSVDRVSINYDAQAGLVTDAGHWNLTTYGTRFIALSRMAGAGGIQITGGCDGFGLGGFGEGW